MNSENKPNDVIADAVLVNPETLADAMTAVEEEEAAGEFDFVTDEPFLSSYCRNEMFQILGKLSVSGASPKVVRGVAAEIHRLISVTARAMKVSYCALLEDFLPEFAVSEAAAPSDTEDEA